MSEIPDPWAQLAVNMADLRGDFREGVQALRGDLAEIRREASHLRGTVSDHSAEIADLQRRMTACEQVHAAEVAVRARDKRRLQMWASAATACAVVGPALVWVLRGLS